MHPKPGHTAETPTPPPAPVRFAGEMGRRFRIPRGGGEGMRMMALSAAASLVAPDLEAFEEFEGFKGFKAFERVGNREERTLAASATGTRRRREGEKTTRPTRLLASPPPPC